MIDTIALRTAAAANLPALKDERDAMRTRLAENREEHERLTTSLKAIDARVAIARAAESALARTPEQVALAEANAAHALAAADLDLARAGADEALIKVAEVEEASAREALVKAQAAMPRGLTLLRPLLAASQSVAGDTKES